MQSFIRKAGSIALALLSLRTLVVQGYPLITEVDHDEEKCFTYVVPPHDEAHMVFLAMHPTPNDEIESYFVQWVHDLTQSASKEPEVMPKILPIPKNVVANLEEEREGEDDPEAIKTGRSANVAITIRSPNKPPVPLLQHQRVLRFNQPTVIQNLRKLSRNSKGYEKGRPDDLFEVCFTNTNKEDIDLDVVFDISLEDQEEELDPEIEAMKRKVVKREHISPLEEQLDEALERAEDILDEFNYLEKRERRMRLTADNTNAKIRMYSYVSIVVLVAVTWMQVTYLKGYFRKKKLM